MIFWTVSGKLSTQRTCRLHMERLHVLNQDKYFRNKCLYKQLLIFQKKKKMHAQIYECVRLDIKCITQKRFVYRKILKIVIF